jgi:leucyl-tRNA synthetase
MAYNFTAIEKKWQRYWLENKTFAAIEPQDAGTMPKAYVLDMFPYPSGAGLHVGHPEGYTATDIVSRFLRMRGFNVLHPMGWDAFGLPAEQYAIKTNTHPRETTEKNIAMFRRQLQSLGFSYDWDREVDTTDPGYYKWTQWIFLQLFNSYFDPADRKAKPIGHLINELMNENLVVAPDGEAKINRVQEGLEAIAGDVRVERYWRELSPQEQREVIDGQRLAFIGEAPVNWCPGLGTVLANEEVIDGKSEVGQHPVERRMMRQWMLRITAYAERLIKDLELLDWPDSLKEMQRNWIGKSVGAEVDFEIAPAPHFEAGDEDMAITVFTTRPDTLYGATYMVLAPEHELVERLTPPERRETVEAYRTMVAGKSERERVAEQKEKTGVFTGGYAINPVNDEKIPIYIADYVLMGYGTGAIMAVPAHDERDYAFAKKFDIPIRQVVKPANGEAPTDRAYVDEGIAINSPMIDGLPTADAKDRITATLAREGNAYRSVNYKLRDWLFSRQRYWGEPFPLLHDVETGEILALDESELPLKLPELKDFRPRPIEGGDADTPVPPLGRANDWIEVWGVLTDAGSVKTVPPGTAGARKYRRELNTMPQWAGSCWYYLRYADPRNDKRFVAREKESYWLPVDLYVGGVEHAVLHLLYSRFWHKVLFDLGQVSTAEPFARLVNQGIITGETEFHVFENAEGVPVSTSDVRDIDEELINEKPAMIAFHRQSGERLIGRRIGEEDVERRGNDYVLKKNPAIKVDARSFKMSKSRGNVVNPDDIVRDYGADCFRLYEMYMGPLEAQKPWNTRDIVGMSRFLNSIWRNLVGDDESATTLKIADGEIPDDLDRQMHKTIKKVGDDIASLSFNTAIAKLIELNNQLNKLPAVPRTLAENLILMLSPFAPHVAEELWSRLGHTKSLSRRPWPEYEPGKLVDSMIDLPVQVNGKVRDKITVPADSDEESILAAAEKAPGVQPWIAGKRIVKRLYVTKRLVNFVVA